MALGTAFDAIGTLFDLEPLRKTVDPRELCSWFEAILHSAASLTLAGAYVPFDELAAWSVPGDDDALLRILAELPPKPDARDALVRAQAAGPVAVLTNGTRAHLQGLLERGGLAELVDAIVSVEDVRRYKPHPAVYLNAAEALGLEPDQVRLVSAHAWDVAGAREVGLEAVWVNREAQVWPFPRAAGALEQAPDLSTAVG